MNLYLHGIGPTTAEGEPPVDKSDALASDPGTRFEVVLTNPPCGRKSSVLIVTAEGEQEREDLTVVREDFWVTTSNKQLNFVQHVKTLLKINGRAAVVVPDNVLFEGGAGETVRPQTAPRMRRPYAAATADGHLLLAGREGQRPLLRPTAGQCHAVNECALDLRLPHERPYDPKDQPAEARRSRRVRFVLSRRESARSSAYVVGGPSEPPLASVHLRRADAARQSEPRHLLAQRRQSRRRGESSGAQGHRRSDHRRSGRRARAVRADH